MVMSLSIDWEDKHSVYYCYIDAYCIIREEDEGAESRSGVVFLPLVEDGGAELQSSKKLIQI